MTVKSTYRLLYIKISNLRIRLMPVHILLKQLRHWVQSNVLIYLSITNFNPFRWSCVTYKLRLEKPTAEIGQY
jgi:hypothetical protein